MRGLTYLIGWLIFLWVPVSSAQEDEEYLLGDLGVRLELADAWRMTRWSDWDFKAQLDQGPVLLWVWATAGQVPPGADPGAWVGTYSERIESEGGREWSYERGAVGSVAGGEALLLEMTFEAGRDGTRLYLYGATFAVEGHNVHLATLGTDRHKKRALSARSAVLENIEIRSPPVSFARQRDADAQGVSLVFPDGFRPALAGEEEKTMMSQVASLPVSDFSDCIVAMRPLPLSAPDVMVMCQGGIWLGVVDEHTLSSVGKILSDKLFGTRLSVDPPTSLQLSDRMGWIYKPELETFSLSVGVAAYDQGVARYWVLSDEPGQDLSPLVREVMQSSSFSGAHPEPVGAQVRYWLMHRTTSPQTLAALFFVLGLPVGWFGLRGGFKRRRKRFEWEDEVD